MFMFINFEHFVRGIFVLYRPNHCINDADFEELMNRNRAVASTAITKAVSSATVGVYNRLISSWLTKQEGLNSLWNDLMQTTSLVTLAGLRKLCSYFYF